MSKSKQQIFFDYDKVINGGKALYSTGENCKRKKIGIIYVRVSDMKQIKEGSGIDGQTRACTRYAEENDIEIVSIFEDRAETGRNLNRKGIEDAISFLEEKNKKDIYITHFIVTELSRISRSEHLDQTLTLEKKIQATGVRIICATQYIDTSTDEGMLTKNLGYTIAAYESKKISKRTIYGQKGRIMNGYRPFNRPMGYKPGKAVDQTTGKEEVVAIKNEPTASILSEGLKKFADGTFLTKADFHIFLQSHSLRSNSRNAKSKLCSTIVDKLLEPEKLLFYAGYVMKPVRGITEPIKGKHEPIIDLEIVKKIRARFKKDTDVIPVIENKRADISEQLPLRGLLICPSCGNRLTGGPCRGRRGKRYFYYYCQSRFCEQRGSTVSVKRVHEDVKKSMCGWKMDEGMSSLFDCIFSETLADVMKTIGNTQENKEKRMVSIEREIQSIVDKMMSVSNPTVLQTFEKKIEILQQEKDKIESELTQKNKEDVGEEVYKETAMLFSNLDKIRDIDDIYLRQLLIGVLYNGKILYKKNSGVLNPEISLISLLFRLSGSIKNQMGDEGNTSRTWWCAQVYQKFVEVQPYLRAYALKIRTMDLKKYGLEMP